MVLVVDDELDVLEMFQDLIVPQIHCRVVTAASLTEARRVLVSEAVALLIADVQLPDGSGTGLLEDLRLTSPEAGVIFMTAKPTVEQTLFAWRHGALDYLSKPFNTQQMTQHVSEALHRQAIASRDHRRLSRLKSAVRGLNKSRRTVTQKVDLLCNDLVSAYGEIAEQMQDVRIQESFRKACTSAKDMEQMLCHAMDWLLKEAGYANIAIWLSGEPTEFELGAYMKYTIAGEKKVTAALQSALVQSTVREGFVHFSDSELQQLLKPAEQKVLANQTVMSAACTYLGEALGVVMLFRDGKCPFKEEDAAMLKRIAPIFATMLAQAVRPSDSQDASGPAEDNGYWSDEPKEPKKNKKPDPADWWKNGQPPPF